MITNLNELFLEQIKDIYDAEQQALKAIPRMASMANSPEIRQAFSEHAGQTRNQIQRLEQIFQKLGQAPEGQSCKGMEGLVAEAEEHMQDGVKPEYRDSMLVGAGQKTEHYEIAAYTAAQELAESMGNREAARRLRQNLAEEERMSKKLAQLSTRWLKKTVREEQQSAREEQRSAA